MNRLLSRNEPLSNVDAAWLRMEDPTNLMMVSGILTFAKPVDFEHLKAVINFRLLTFDRFRQRVVESRRPLAGPAWEEDPTFDLDAHLHRIALPAPGGMEALRTLVGDLMSTPLDFSKPLWQFHVVENVDGGTAIVCRLHHAIADGMALVYVLLSLTDMTPDAPPPKPPARKKESETGIVGSLFRQAEAMVGSARQMSGRVFNESMSLVKRPSRVIELARFGTNAATTLAGMTLRWPDPQTLFKGELGVAKRAAWSQSLSLADVKKVRKVMGGTVNDVLLTAMTGGLRRYMIDRGATVEGLNFRAGVPVNLRQPEEMGTLGNKFGLIFLSLPVGIADPLERLHELKQRMDAQKDSPEAVVALGVLAAMGMSPADIQDIMVTIFGQKITAVMTNVPGPPIPLYLAGSEINDIMFWVPQSGRVGLGVSIISYAGKVLLGVATDRGLVPDPEKIITGFEAEFESMMDLVRQAEVAETPAKPAPAASTTTPQGSLAAHPDQCAALTKSGRRCRNRVTDGEFCHVHG